MESDANIKAGGLREVVRLAGPASVSMLSRTLTLFIDGLMVSVIGPAAMSAQLVAGMMALVPDSFVIGALGVVTAFVGQNLGAGRLKRCSSYTWSGLGLGVIFAALIMPLALLARPIFAAAGHAPDVQAMEVMYFRYMVLIVPVNIFLRVLESFFYGIGRSGIIFVGAFAANVFHVASNWLLIYGNLGAPRLGLEGAAISSCAAAGLNLLILAAPFLGRKLHERYGTRLWRTARLQQMRDILRVGWPAGISILLDIGSWTVFTTFMIGRFGTEHLAANTIGMRYMSVSFMPAIGISIAATSLVGRYIGERRPEVALARAHTAIRLAIIYTGLCGLAFFIFRHDLIRLFVMLDASAAEGGVAEHIVLYGGRIMICAAIFQIFDCMNIVYGGALRGAGDTLWPMAATGVLCAALLIGGGFVMAGAFPQLGSLGPYISATIYIIVLGLVMRWRFESGRWRRFRLLGGRAPTVVPPSIEPVPVTVTATTVETEDR